MDIEKYISLLQSKLEMARSPTNSTPMKKYMKDHFDYLGIKSPERKVLFAEFLKENGIPEVPEISTVIKALWELPYREYQYCAMVLVEKTIKKVGSDFLPSIEYMILNKSWWDTVDFVAASIAGSYFKRFTEFLPNRTNDWSESNNMWLNRSAIIYQLKYYKNTDKDLLARYILPHTESKEFFIQKAIGWSLRQFSKTDPEWVRKFISTHQLAPLSVREGLKLLIDD
jgi:3-methyladenine DNA glycosylase AlkD